MEGGFIIGTYLMHQTINTDKPKVYKITYLSTEHITYSKDNYPKCRAKRQHEARLQTKLQLLQR